MPQSRVVDVPASAANGSVASSTKNRAVSTCVTASEDCEPDSVTPTMTVATTMPRTSRFMISLLLEVPSLPLDPRANFYRDPASTAEASSRLGAQRAARHRCSVRLGRCVKLDRQQRSSRAFAAPVAEHAIEVAVQVVVQRLLQRRHAARAGRPARPWRAASTRSSTGLPRGPGAGSRDRPRAFRGSPAARRTPPGTDGR